MKCVLSVSRRLLLSKGVVPAPHLAPSPSLWQQRTLANKAMAKAAPSTKSNVPRSHGPRMSSERPSGVSKHAPIMTSAHAATMPPSTIAINDPVILPLHNHSKPAMPVSVSSLPSSSKPAPTTTCAEPLSKRKQFLATRYLPATLAHIRSAGLGENRWPVDKPNDQVFLYPRPGQQPLEFLAAAKKTSSFWPNERRLPELAVIGRSNVGKSRLLNATFGTSVVRVKDKPGLTQSINWYRAANPLGALVVDMPGYGFAFAKEELKSDWDQLLLDFLARDTLVRLLVLVDARHGIKVNDMEFLEKLKGLNHFRLTIVMTKCDLVRMEILARQHRLVCDKVHELLGMPTDEVLMVSSRTGAGIVHLRQSILQHVKSLAPKQVSLSAS